MRYRRAAGNRTAVGERPLATMSVTAIGTRTPRSATAPASSRRSSFTAVSCRRMFFRQVLNDDLGCASYVIADGGQAAVIDPKWEIEDYLQLADEHGFRIAHILETHNHADHVSGHGRLAAATGARIYVSADAGVEYEHVPLADGDSVAVGEIQVTALATPGHRPEHMAYLVADGGRTAEPWLAVTGDSLFVGDLARPDLAVEPEEGARGLFRSVRRLLELEDFAEAWPGHVGGSLCGGAG